MRPAGTFIYRCLLTACLSVVCLASMRAQLPPWKDDARLERRVTVEAEGLPVGELLERLSDTAGVTLAARGGMADEKAVLFVAGCPLGTLLADLAALFDATWEREDAPGAPRYALILGPAARRREAALAREATAALARRMDEYVRGLDLTPEELADRPEDDPVREYLSAPDTRMGIALYALLSTAQREALWTTRRLSAPYASLTPPQQRAIAGLMQRLIHRVEEVKRVNPNAKVTVPRMEDLPESRVQFRVRRMGGHAVLFLQLPGAGIPLGAADAQAGFLLPPHGDPYNPRHPVPSGPLPTAESVRAATGTGTAFPDSLHRLAKETGRPVLADFYRSRPLAAPVLDPTIPTDSPIRALDAFCGKAGYLWWHRGDALLFRKRDWYVQKLAEPPDSLLHALAASLKASAGQPVLADVLRLRALTPAQIAGMNSIATPLADETLLDGLPDLLALLAALPADRAKAVFAPDGLSIAPTGRSRPVRTLLERFTAARDMPESEADTMMTVRATRTPRNDGRTVRIDLSWILGRVTGIYTLLMPADLADESGKARIEAAPEGTP